MKEAAPSIINNKGKWVEKKTLSTILMCECGSKYIKTRRLQSRCLRCVFESEPKRTN